MRPVRTPSLHQGDQVVPDGLELAHAQGVAGSQRVHPVTEQDLGAVDVADAGDDRLVQEQVADRSVAALDPRPGPGRVGVGAQRVRTQRRDHLVVPVAADQVALDGATQVGVRRLVLQPQPDLTHRHGHRRRVEVELADQAEVDVDEPVAGELDEQVLAGRVGADQGLAVEQGGVRGEPALRAAHPDPVAGERGVQVVGEAAEGVALRHRARARSRAAAGGRRSTRSRRACRSGVRAAPRR